MKIRFTCPPDLYDLLPRPQLARRTTPDWYKAMPMENPVPDGGADLTVKHCMPFIDALTTGFIIPLQADITVKHGQFSWDWAHDESPLGIHFPTQAPGVPFIDPDQVVVKAHNFWAIHSALSRNPVIRRMSSVFKKGMVLISDHGRGRRM